MDRTYESHIPPNLPCPDPEGYKHFKAQIALQDETARLKAELAKLREIIGLVNYYFEVRAKDPQCAGEVFRDLGQKMQALKGE